MTGTFENGLLALKWNVVNSQLEPPGAIVYVFTADLEIRRGKRHKYSTSYSGLDYVCADSGEKLGRVLYWAYV